MKIYWKIEDINYRVKIKYENVSVERGNFNCNNFTPKLIMGSSLILFYVTP